MCIFTFHLSLAWKIIYSCCYISAEAAAVPMWKQGNKRCQNIQGQAKKTEKAGIKPEITCDFTPK